MPDRGTLALIVGLSIGGFSLLLLIISVGTVTWADDNSGSSVGLFRKCYGGNYTGTTAQGCYNENRAPQAGLSVFGILLLSFAIIVAIANIFLKRPLLLFIGLGLFYFASMFVMATYATWGHYSRSPSVYFFPYSERANEDLAHTSMGASYHLCVAAHYFLWTALTLLAFGAGYSAANGDSSSSS